MSVVIVLSTISFNSSAVSEFGFTKAKQCYALCQKIQALRDDQYQEKCKRELTAAEDYTEQAAIKLVDDEYYAAKELLEEALKSIKHALVFNCETEKELIEIGEALWDIKSDPYDLNITN